MPLAEAAQGEFEVLRLRGRPLASSADVAAYLDVPRRRLIGAVYRASEEARYNHFEIPKRSGGMRAIHSPNGLLRELQDKLHRDFQTLYQGHPSAHGFILHRSVATNAADHTGKRWVLNVDLENFFPSINFGRIRGLFMKPPFEMGPAAATVCAQIVTFRNGLPQGAPTSPVLSNFIAAALDRRLLRLARQHKLVYSRYADDITLSTDLPQFPPSIAVREEIEGGGFKVAAGDALVQAIAACGFTINPAKVRIQGQGVHQSVTGICVNRRLNVDRQRIRRIRAMLHAWRKFGLAAAAREHFEKYRGVTKRGHGGRGEAAFRNIVYGQIAYVKMVRGASDPLFLKLCAGLLELDPNPSRFLRQMVFGADNYDVFISHASEDKPTIARPIFEACASYGVKAFLDEEHIGWGQNFATKINTALGASRTVLAVVSNASVTKEWPLLEINTALALEVSGAKRVLPLIVGRPDLARLPLIRSKKWLVWDGDPAKVAAALKELVRPPPAVPKRGPVSSVPIIRVVPAAMPRPPKASRGWLSRLWRRDPD